ncbi:MAG: trigger factor [Candidatus Shapirobacteria bacterium]|jgi:FKBP-type peptidyl-prolyl cis-trans isomerase (trigger factor)
MTDTSTDLVRNPDNSFTLTLTASITDIDQSRQEVLQNHQQSFQKDGFRPGKAPLSMVEESIPLTHLIEDVASSVFSKLYGQKIKDYQLKPIIPPKISFQTPPIDLVHEWQASLTSCELPPHTLDPLYQADIKSLNAQGPTGESAPQSDKDGKVAKYYDILIKYSHCDLPEILLETEIQHRLSGLIDQTSQAGLTVDQYLRSKNTTLEQYRQQLASRVTQDWKINQSISLIAQEQNIQVSQEELNSLKAKNHNLSNPNILYFVLLEQKVVSFLSSL